MRRLNLISLKCASAVAVFVLTVAAASANDIEDFLRALREPAPSRQREAAATAAGPRFHGRSPRSGIRGDDTADFRDAEYQRVSPRGHLSPAFPDNHEVYDLRQADHRRRIPLTIRPDSRLSYVRGQEFAPDADDHSGYGDSGYGIDPDGGYEIAPVPLPPAPRQRRPSLPDAAHQDHQIGDIVHCPVALEPCVRIEGSENIAPHARPVVMVVKDPHSSAHHSGCHDSMVYVVVYLPPCPPDCVTISPCGTRITLSFEDYDVKIRSRRGWVVISYCD